MAKIEITRTELVWPGKYNADGTRKEVPRVSLPFQVIETVNESRATREAQKGGAQGTLFDVYEGKEGAEFLDKVGDVLRFASLGTTEQDESGTPFRVDYLKPSGAIGFYYPDWVVVQKTKAGEVNWITETKGRVWEGTAAKDDAIKDWCERVSAATGATWRYVRINQTEFVATARTLQELVDGSAVRRGGASSLPT